MPAQPFVTVLISAHNDAALLPATVNSVLAQTFTDFELLLIDDGSTDDTAAYLATLCDPRIVILRNDNNRGLTWSLRAGVERARGRYIARLDAGDYSHPERLLRQVSFMEQHPAVGILGSACRHLDPEGRSLGTLNLPETDAVIRWTSLIQNPFCHSAVIVRTETLRRHNLNYDTAFQTTQDYELWTRLLEHAAGANLRQKLTTLHYREGITQRNRPEQLQNHSLISMRTIGKTLPGARVAPEDIRAIQRLLGAGLASMPDLDQDRPRLAEVYLDLFSAYSARLVARPSDQRALRRTVALRAARIALRPPWRAATWRIARRLLSLDAGFPARFLLHLASAAWRRAYERIGKAA